MTSIAGNRRRAPSFDLEAYGRDLEAFHAELGEARWALATGARDELRSAPILAAHAALFDRTAVDALRRLAASDGDPAAQAAGLVATAVDGHAEQQVAELTDQIRTAEARAAIIWRGERIAYRAAPRRIAEMSNRGERNALEASYQDAVEAINPLREERLGRLHEVATALGYADYTAMVSETRGFDVQALAAEMQRFLAESETVYFAALRRYLAEIDIEQGDASGADLSHVLAGNGWDAWFDARRITPDLSATLAGMGIDLAAQSNVTLDQASGANRAPGPMVVAVRVPQDVRLALQPVGGNRQYAATLYGIGAIEELAHVAADLPAAYRLGGDPSVSHGHASLFEALLLEPTWLTAERGMPDDEMVGWLDFASFRRLHAVRRDVAQLLYELRLHQGVEPALHRAYYSGMLGLLTGVRYAEPSYLVEVERGFDSAARLRGACYAAMLVSWLRDHHGASWWREAAAGDLLRRGWSRGRQLDAEALVAHLGYDALDWRPILRQIRTQLIGEMSGYGGPNITTRAGTRKV
jgi:hypothetical protein